MSPAEFVVSKLNEPGVSLTAVSRATGISRGTLGLLRSGKADKAWLETINLVAEHFGYRLEAVPVAPTVREPRSRRARAAA